MEYQGIFPVLPQTILRSKVFTLNINLVHVRTEATSSPVRIRAWADQRMAGGGNMVFGFTLKTKTLRNRNLKAVVCAFAIGTNCLVVQLDTRDPYLLLLGSLCCIHVVVSLVLIFRNSWDILYRGIRMDVVQPVSFNINAEAARSYGVQNLLQADQKGLMRHIFNAYPQYPAFVYDRYDGLDQLEDGQVVTLAIDAYSAFRMHGAILANDGVGGNGGQNGGNGNGGQNGGNGGQNGGNGNGGQNGGNGGQNVIVAILPVFHSSV